MEKVARYDNTLLGSIGALKRRLQSVIEPSYDLLPQLVSRGVINESDVRLLRSKSNTKERNETLIEYLCSQSEAMCEQFIEALAETSQKHVVHFIRHPHGL